MQRQTFLRITYVALTIVVLSLTLASTAWATEYKVLYKFRGGDAGDGSNPIAGLIFDAAGNLYGTTYSGGIYGYGTAFKVTSNPDGSWTETVLRSFSGRPDGSYPHAGLIFDTAGNLYGTTEGGGRHSGGAVFRLAPNPDGSWTETVLANFTGDDGEGGWIPEAGLIFDAAGNLYGTTAEPSESATIFRAVARSSN